MRISRPEDVAFVINPSLWYQRMYPTGILCLASYLEQHGRPSVILDSGLSTRRLPPPRREAAILDWVRGAKPRVVCFSSTHREFDEVTRLNAAVRSMGADVISIVGGSQATYRASDFLNNGFDFVCAGEGEKTLLQFVEECATDSPQWEAIEGLHWRRNGEVFANPPRALMTESELDFDITSAYRKIDRRYFDISVELIRGVPLAGALLWTTRGCPYSCSFCGCNSIFGRRLRRRSLESIEREVRFLATERAVEGIWVLDDTFTVDKVHAAGVAAVLDRYKLVWGCQSRVDGLSPDFVRELRARGCVQMDFGVESGSQRILGEIVGKRTTVDRVAPAFALAKEMGIRTLANFMIGLPTETEEDLAATKNLAREIKADAYVFSIATPLPGTRLYEMVGEDIRPHDYSLLNWNGSAFTEKLNKSEIRNVVRERRKLELRYLAQSILKAALSLEALRFTLLRRRRLERVRAALQFLARVALRN
jgi:anaerobic magnesium-protoporphyrin IX monomethyl ester cyclase